MQTLVKISARHQGLSAWKTLLVDRPVTMRVKVNPFFTVLRFTWLGRVAKPTYSLSWSCWAHTVPLYLVGTGVQTQELLQQFLCFVFANK